MKLPPYRFRAFWILVVSESAGISVSDADHSAGKTRTGVEGSPYQTPIPRSCFDDFD
jgi:hypothetical protein